MGATSSDSGAKLQLTGIRLRLVYRLPDFNRATSSAVSEMRVSFVTTSIDVGGAETVLVALAVRLQGIGVDVSVLAMRGSGRLVQILHEAGIPCIQLHVKSFIDFAAAIPRGALALRSSKPDIVQGWMYHGNLLAAAIVPACCGRLVWGVRQALGALDRESGTTNRLIRLGACVSRLPASIIYNSHRSRYDHEAIGYNARRSVVIDNGVDTDALIPDAGARTRWRMRLGLSADTSLIGMVARYHPVKDHLTFLRAAAELAAERKGLHFILAGKEVTPANGELAASIAQSGLTGQVHLLGEVDNVAGLMAALDVLCVSSRSEAFPNVVAEAMSCGVPCVSTDVGDVARIIGGIGSVVPAGDPRALVRAINGLIERSPEQVQQLGSLARSRIIEHFSLNQMTGRYAELYSGCL